MKKVEVGKYAKIVLLDNTTAVSGTITYSSSNTSIATVNSQGVVFGVAAGTSLISATNTANGRNAAVTIEIVTAGVTTQYAASVIDYILVPTPASFTSLTNGAITNSLVVGTAANTRFYNPQGISIDPSTGLIYIAELQGNAIVELNPSTGATRIVTLVGPAQGFNAGAYSVLAPGNGKVYFAAYDGNMSVYSALISTGVQTLVASPAVGGNQLGRMVLSGNLLFVNQFNTKIYKIDLANSNTVTTFVTDTASSTSLALYNGFVYYYGTGGLKKIATTGGTITTVTATSIGTATNGLFIDSDGLIYGNSSSPSTQGKITTFNPTDSTITVIYSGSTLAGIRDLAISSSKTLYPLIVDGTTNSIITVKKSI